MNKPKLTIIEPIGYCEGVNFIISKIKQISCSKENLYVIDDLIHNVFFQDEFSSLNFIKAKSIADIPYGSTIVWPGHGHTSEEENEANKLNLNQIDCTCPYLQSLFTKIKNSNKKYVYLGKPDHRESKTFLSFDNVKPFDADNCPSNEFLINQSTIIPTYDNSLLKSNKILNTTCPRVLERTNNFKNALHSNCFAIICGDKKSSNTTTLFKIACEIVGKEKAAFVESVSDLDNLSLTNCSEIVLVSGTSTPNIVVTEIINKIKLL